MTTRNVLSGSNDDPLPPPDGNGSAGFQSEGSGGGEAVGVRGGRIRAPIDPVRDLECCRLPLTDLGNAERWRVRYGDTFRFCAELGWFHWDGRRWALLSEEKDALPAEVMQSVFGTIRAIRNEAALVAASGYPTIGLTAKQEDELSRWAEAHGTTSRELYLSGDDDGARAQWLEDREPMDIVLGKTLWSQKIAAFAKTSEGAGRIGSVARLAKAFPEIAIRPDQLDRDRMAINVLNGTIRFKRRNVQRSAAERADGKSQWKTDGWKAVLDPHRREDLMTKVAPVKWRAGAKCPAYDQFIAEVQPDPEMRRFLHQWGGYSLTGEIGEHKLAFFHGGGRNGKGTWVEAVAHLAGDYAGSIGIESLLDAGGKRRGDQATPDLARLPGVRFLRVSEPQVGMKFNDGLIKQLTGGDPVDARHLNKGFFTYLPSFKLTISGNTKPNVRDLSHGMWSRLRLVPWDVEIAEDRIDTGLVDKLKGEAGGILARLIEGICDWLEHGLVFPEAVLAATRAYRDRSDELGRFLSALCEVGDPGDITCRVPAGELYELYRAWSDAADGSGWTAKGFAGAMTDKKFEVKQSNGRKWLGLRLRAGVNMDDVKRGIWPADDAETAHNSPDDGFDPWGDIDG